VEHAAAEGTTTALIMLDIDLFKKYNDTYGHSSGDDALRTVVMAIAQNVKSTDSVGRWGGEEFGVLLPGASCANALQVAYRIRATLARIEMPVHNGTRLPVPTISQGIACYPADSQTSAELVDHADMALYQAKARGRDCIVHWDQLSAPVLGKQ
jgi:diguanylate cyclase (GGDEF)-like protein